MAIRVRYAPPASTISTIMEGAGAAAEQRRQDEIARQQSDRLVAYQLQRRQMQEAARLQAEQRARDEEALQQRQILAEDAHRLDSDVAFGRQQEIQEAGFQQQLKVQAAAIGQQTEMAERAAKARDVATASKFGQESWLNFNKYVTTLMPRLNEEGKKALSELTKSLGERHRKGEIAIQEMPSAVAEAMGRVMDIQSKMVAPEDTPQQKLDKARIVDEKTGEISDLGPDGKIIQGSARPNPKLAEEAKIRAEKIKSAAERRTAVFNMAKEIVQASKIKDAEGEHYGKTMKDAMAEAEGLVPQAEGAVPAAAPAGVPAPAPVPVAAVPGAPAPEVAQPSTKVAGFNAPVLQPDELQMAAVSKAKQGKTPEQIGRELKAVRVGNSYVQIRPEKMREVETFAVELQAEEARLIKQAKALDLVMRETQARAKELGDDRWQEAGIDQRLQLRQLESDLANIRKQIEGGALVKAHPEWFNVPPPPDASPVNTQGPAEAAWAM